MADNIKVAVRIRPLLQKEQRNGLTILWNVKDNGTITSNESSASDGYTFDSVYDHTDTTYDLYGELCSPIIKNAAEGFNGTIFAYGQSGSGKTHTISGSEVQLGVIEQGVDELFDIIDQSTNKEFLLRISYMEIYTEKIYDLFDDIEKTLKLQEDTNHQISVVGLNEQIVNSKEQVMKWIIRGETKRKFAETKANDRSSRSHVILRIIIESRLKGDVDAVMVSHLNFVDLAGSEKAADNSGERFREGCAINRSLLTLSQVISKLSEGDSAYIGYRDSKLTRILQNALGGNSNTLIICTIAPASMDESHSTLRFASRAKTIKNKPILNEVLSDSALLKKYANEIKKLQKKVDKMGMQDMQLEKEDLEKKLQEKEDIQKQQDELINKLRQMICVSGANNTRETKVKKLRRETWCGKKLKKSSSAFDDFRLPSSVPLFLPNRDLPQMRKPLSSRHFSFSALEEEEPSFLDPPAPDELLTADDVLFMSLETTDKKCFITDSRHSGRRSDLGQTHKKEIENLKKENEELQQINTRLGKQVLDLESKNEKQETDLVTIKVKLNQVMEDMTLQSLELDKATAMARHDISMRDLQEFHRLEKDDLEEQIAALMKKKEELEGEAVPADVQYVKKVEMELTRNYDKMMELTKSNKDMEKENDKLKKELALSRGEVERKLRTNDDYIGMLEKQVNQSQEKIKSYERMSVGSVPVGKQLDATLEATVESLRKDKDDLEALIASKNAEITQLSGQKRSSSIDQCDMLKKLDSQLTDLLKEKTESEMKFEKEREKLEKVIVEKDAELDALAVASVTQVTTEEGNIKAAAKGFDDQLDNGELVKQLSDQRQEQEGMQAQNEELVKQLSDYRQEQEVKLQQNGELVKQLSDQRQEQEGMQAQYEELVKQLSDYKQDQELKLQQNEELVKQLSDQRQEQEGMQAQYEELVKQLSDYKQDQELKLQQNEELVKQLSDQRQEQEVMQAQNEELVKQLSDYRQEQEVKLQQNGELVKQLSDQRQEQEGMQAQNEETVKQLSDYRQEQEVKLQQNEELVKQLSDQRQEQEVMLAQYEETVKQLSDYRQDQELKLQQNEELVKQLSDQRQEQEGMQAQNEELVKQLSDYRQEQEVKLQQNEELVKQLSDQRQEQEGMQAQNEELVKQLSDYRQEQELKLQQNEELVKQLSDQRQEQEVMQAQNEELVKQLNGAKLELEVMLAERICSEDKVNDLEKIIQEKISLNTLRDKETLRDISKKGNNFERSMHMSQSDIVIHSFDADVTVSNVDLSVKLSDGPMSIADELSLASRSKAQSLSLADELTFLSRQQMKPMSLADELNTVTQPGQTAQAVLMKDEELQTSLDIVDKVQCKTDIEEQLKSMTEEMKNIKQDKLDMARNLQVKESEVKNLTQTVCKLERDLDERQEELETFSDELLRRQDLISENLEKRISLEQELREQKEAMEDQQVKTKQLKKKLEKRENGLTQNLGNHTSEIIAEQKVSPQLSDDTDTEEDEVTFSVKEIAPEVSQSKIRDLEAVINEKECLLEAAKIEHKEQEMKIQDLHQHVELHSGVDNEGKIIKLECSLHERVSEIEDLKCEKLELEHKLKDLQGRLQEKSECQPDVSSSEDSLKRGQELQADIQEKQEQLDKTSQELQKVQEEMTTVRTSLEAASALLEVKDREVFKLVEQRNSDLEEIAKLQRETQEEIRKNKENVDMKENEISELKVSLKNLKSYVAEKESKTSEKDVAIEELEAKLSAAVALEEEGKELTIKLNQSVVNVEAKAKQIDEMTEMIAQGKIKLEVYEMEVETLNQRVVEVQEQMAMNEAEFDDIKVAGMEKIDSLTDESSELQYKVAHLESCLEEKENEIHDINDQVDKIIQDKLQDSQMEILAKEQEIKSLLDSVSSLEEVIKDKDHEIERVLSEKMKLQEGGEEMLKLVQEKHELEEKLREKTIEMASLEDEKSRIETELTHKTTELQVMVEYKNKQDVELEEKITEIESLSNEILKLEDNVVEKAQDLGILQEEKMSTEAILQNKSALLEDLGKKMNEFENLFQEKSDEVDQCRVCIQTLEGTIKILEEELQKITNKKSQEVHGSELHVLRTNLQSKVEEVSRLKAEIERLMETSNRKCLLNHLFARLNTGGKSDLTGFIEALDKEGHDDLAIQLRELNVKLAIERVEINQKQKLSETELKEKDRKIKQINKAMEDLMKKVMEHAEKIDSLEEELETVRGKLAAETKLKVKLNLEVHSLRDKAREAKERKNALEEEVEYQEGVVKKLKAKMRTLQQSYDASFAVSDPPEKQEVSSRSGIIDQFKVCILEGEKKQLQLRVREEKAQIARCYMQIKSLEEENDALKKNVIGTPKNMKQENEEKASPEFNWSLSELFKKRRSLSYEEVKEKAEAIRKKNATPLKDSSKENQLKSPTPVFSTGRLTGKSSAKEGHENCKIQ
ncbi:centromere-associated protein E-like [Haliotis rufescens]|uniref:centromere-associated protein E-like n=1 Tax=Haliotis rufescens TaxID=6454 RepID=UPI00201E7EEC|nr:centromere-associated protein E-like [Haliotis rufescens]